MKLGNDIVWLQNGITCKLILPIKSNSLPIPLFLPYYIAYTIDIFIIKYLLLILTLSPSLTRLQNFLLYVNISRLLNALKCILL